MQYLNGVYTQRFNRIHNKVGHVFQGRFKSILVEKENYLLDQDFSAIPSPQYAPMVLPLTDYEQRSSSRNQALKLAYASGSYGMKELGDYFGLHYSRVSRIINSK